MEDNTSPPSRNVARGRRTRGRSQLVSVAISASVRFDRSFDPIVFVVWSIVASEQLELTHVSVTISFLLDSIPGGEPVSRSRGRAVS